jgi:hypothetical protein
MGYCYPHLHLNPTPRMQGSCASSSEIETLHRQAQQHPHLLAGRSGLDGMDLVWATQALVAQVYHLE